MKQLTEAQAIRFYQSEKWRRWPMARLGAFCIRQTRLCVPFDVFHEAVEAALGRPVWTHEFANQKRLIDELDGKRAKATMDDVIYNLIEVAGDKPIVPAVID